MKSRHPAEAPRLYRPPARTAFTSWINRHKWTVAAAAVVMPFAVAMAGSSGCSGEAEESEAVDIASSMPPPPTVSVPLDDDAGAPDEPDASKPKKAAAAVDPTGLQACCHALRQNAKTAPEESKDAMTRAADVCDSVVRSPEARRGLIAVRGVLQGAKLPAECK